MNEPGRKYFDHEVPLFVREDRPVFLLTICAKNRRSKPLATEGVSARLIEAARHYHAEGKWWMHAVVVMPDHLHMVASFGGEMTTIVPAWKRWTARETGVVWQKGFFEHRIRHDESLREKMDYVLMNPVRAGLVEDWQDWEFYWIGE